MTASSVFIELKACVYLFNIRGHLFNFVATELVPKISYAMIWANNKSLVMSDFIFYALSREQPRVHGGNIAFRQNV